MSGQELVHLYGYRPVVKPGHGPERDSVFPRRESQEKINICLNCTKPASECRGGCCSAPKEDDKKYVCIEDLARYIYNGCTESFCAREFGISERRVKSYKLTEEFKAELERLRGERKNGDG